MTNAQFKFNQLLAIAPNSLFELTGIRFAKITYEMSIYDSETGTNELETQHYSELVYVNRHNGFAHKVTELQALTIFTNRINAHMYKKLVRQYAQVDPFAECKDKLEMDMKIPLEKFEKMQTYNI
jgi:hypothetical protein